MSENLKIAILHFVDITVDKKTRKETQSNKYYRMYELADGTFRAEFGREGISKPNIVPPKPMREWDKIIREKVKKGYKDLSDMKIETAVLTQVSNNKDFDEFYTHFAPYCRDAVKKVYKGSTCTPKQMTAVQNIINQMQSIDNSEDFNESLKEIYRIIPRVMKDVRDFLIIDGNTLTNEQFNRVKNSYIEIEQNALDSMDASNVINQADVAVSLGVSFRAVTPEEMKSIEETVCATNSSRYKIHKAFAVVNPTTQAKFDKYVATQKNITKKLLIHGTRNPNIFSILDKGLLIRPTGVYYSGSVYGDGVYHSAHTDKSLGYTGRETDAIFFLQEVHLGNFYTYQGWYRDGKDISKSDMNYQNMQKKGYDSLYVKAGDGLQNSEYIVYNSDQTTVKFIVWFRMKG